MLNQFCEFGNHLAHYEVTGRALGHVFEHVRAASGRDLRLAAFVSATGSAGTIAAGDRLKESYGTKIVAVEALECPTLLENGFGEHNIQGIGDKHVPLIHNVMNTDVVVGVSDRATDRAAGACSTRDDGLGYLADRRLVPAVGARHAGALRAGSHLQRAGRDQDRQVAGPRPRRRDRSPSPPTAPRCTRASGTRSPPATSAAGSPTSTPPRCGASTSPTCPTAHAIECTERDRNRIFNLGYYTWVEQQGTPFELFEARRSQDFWRGLRRFLPVWDDMIGEFNARVAAG